MIEKIKSISKVQWLAVALIIVGVAIMIPKAMGMVEFYKESRYAAEHDFSAGNLSPDLIAPVDEHPLHCGGFCRAANLSV